jgi:hypothetical protein
MAIGAVLPLLEDEAAKVEKDFAMLVHDRKHKLLLPVAEGDMILPFITPDAVSAQPDTFYLDNGPSDNPQERIWWRMELAERRMRDALDRWISADNAGRSVVDIKECEAIYHHEAKTHATILSTLGHRLRLD